MSLLRVTTTWTGFQGAPGYSNFHFTTIPTGGSAEDARSRVVGFFAELADILPSEVNFVVEGEVARIDEESGMITDYEMVHSDPVPGYGGDVTGYSAASGAVVTWNTNGVRNGRRVRGRTFIVPLGGSAYQNDGTLQPATISTIQDAASELVGEGFDSGFCVWSRPNGQGEGGVYPVTSYRVPDMSAVLRSRRD